VSGETVRHLLIDGSNILHAWPELRVLLKRDRDAARSRLVSAAAGLQEGDRLRVSLVFDGRGPELTVEHPSGQPGFAVLYTPSGATADDVIEQLVAKSRQPGDCLVATDDRAERQTIEALGASGLSSADLASWVRQAAGRMGTRLQDRKQANDREWRKRPPG
jgi:predicted RNA-binding protein with PIN domain